MTPGSKEWWIVVQSTQLHEAQTMLRDYKADLLQLRTGPGAQETGPEIARVNDEIHRISQIQNRANISRAVRNLFGEEGWAQVREEVARLEFEEAQC